MKNLSVPERLLAGDHGREPTRAEVIEHLRELIVALDRRVPRLERTGEVDIARDAAALRQDALERIADLERSGS